MIDLVDIKEESRIEGIDFMWHIYGVPLFPKENEILLLTRYAISGINKNFFNQPYFNN